MGAGSDLPRSKIDVINRARIVRCLCFCIDVPQQIQADFIQLFHRIGESPLFPQRSGPVLKHLHGREAGGASGKDDAAVPFEIGFGQTRPHVCDKSAQFLRVVSVCQKTSQLSESKW